VPLVKKVRDAARNHILSYVTYYQVYNFLLNTSIRVYWSVISANEVVTGTEVTKGNYKRSYQL